MSHLLVQPYTIVMRMQDMFPSSIARFEKHRKREDGDYEHVDATRSHLNKRLIGDDDWAEKALERIHVIRLENHCAELDSLRRRKRKKELEIRKVEGPKEPWRPTRHGPLREIILTANAQYFQQQLPNGDNPAEAFEEVAVKWLKKNFGDDIVHAHADHDEMAYHIHAVLLPIKQVEMTRTSKDGETKVIAQRWMIEPAKHPLVRSYEEAQDSVGIAFADINLVRGERRSAAIREARKLGKEPPKRRYHMRSTVWRAIQEARIIQKSAQLKSLENSYLEYGRDVVAREKTVKLKEGNVKRDQEHLDLEKAEFTRKQAEQVTVFAALDAIAEGSLDLSDGRLGPTVPSQQSTRLAAILARMDQFPKAKSRVTSIVAKLSAKLGADATRKAEEEVARDTLAIRRAKNAIDEFVRANGHKAASGLHEAVKGLSACLMTLRRHDPEYKNLKNDKNQR